MTAGQARSSEPTVIYQKASEPETKGKSSGGEEKTYVVQKGDTLQKISEKMYGTTKKWKNIYDANQNILKSPDDIRVGQKLVIPVR
jgi:nucleoid-associated protein YgaU